MKRTCYLIFLALVCSRAAAQTSGDIRLVDGPNEYSGRLEIYLNNEWGTVCYNNSPGAAQAACKQLGYSDYVSVDTVSNLKFPLGNGRSLLSGVDCDYNSGAQHILRCSFSQITNSCQRAQDMGIICSSSSLSPYDTAVRLVDGGTGYPSSGIAEVYLNGQWGTMCGYQILSSEASTICQQLGYTESTDYSSTQSSTKVWLDSVNCGSYDRCLNLCFTYPSSSYAAICSSVAVVNCTFVIDDKDIYPAGSESICTGYLAIVSHLLAIVVGVLVAIFVICILFIVVPIIICCCCIPGCILHSCRERRVVYQVIQ